MEYVNYGTPFPRTPQIEFFTADFTDFTDNFLRTFAIPDPGLIRVIRAIRG